MKLLCTWKIIIILWIHVQTVPGIHCESGTISHLSTEDVLLLKAEEDPKCFTRTEMDFTCFFETADNRTYDLLYSIEDERRCSMAVQGTDEGTFLHICSFPPTDVMFYVEIPLEVVERNTNVSLYNRTVCVEDHILLDPPFNVSLHQNDEAGQLQVSWRRKGKTYCENIMHKIRYSSKSLGERTKEESHILDTLKPGEEVEVQVTLKCAVTSDKGHWSSWSQPVQALVPQSADDVSLICYTSDLQNVTCQWNGSIYGAEDEYKLLYKRCLSSEASSCTEWTECLANEHFGGMCRFHGDRTGKFLVKLSSTPAPLSRTFYSQRFTLNNSIKTSPPGSLRGSLENGKLCLNWDAPLLLPLAHLQYEVSYQTKGGAWMRVSIEGPETGTCLETSTGTQYCVKVRARPKGSIYSGYWSDWSDVLTGDVPTDTGMWLMLCIPLLMLITAIILIPLFSSYFSVLKQHFWPPVPNLDKVLQGFLTEINRQKWDPPLTAKQCPETMTSSVVEIMSEEEVSTLGKQPLEESTQLLTAQGGFSSRVQVDVSPGNEVFPDYVTLNKDTVIICTKRNNYVYEQVGDKVDPVVGEGLLQKGQCPCTEGTVCVPLCLGTEFLNHSYLPIAEAAETCNCKVTATGRPGNLYTNFPRS